jgi:hypothetical protein
MELDIDEQAKLKTKDLRQICTQNLMYTYTVHCTVQIYRFYRLLQGPGKFLRLISHGLSKEVYNLNVYT